MSLKIVALFVINKTGQLFLGNFFRSLEHGKWCWVLQQALRMVGWTSGSARRSGIIKKTVFFAFATSLWSSLVTMSKSALLRRDCWQ